MTQGIDREATSEIVREFGGRPEYLVQILQAIVMRHGWIPEDTIRQLAFELNLSRADVYGVVNYYHDFRTEAPGKHIVKICQAEACQAMGSRALTKHAHEALGAGFHEDGLQSGLAVAEMLGGVRRPWSVANESGRISLPERPLFAEAA